MLHINPDDCLIDEKVGIVVSCLSNHQRITLRCETLEESYIFESYAHFIADGHGKVELSSSPSFGGSYKGVDSMGIFWSMLPAKDQKIGIKYKSKNIQVPCKYNLQVYNGFLDGKAFEKSRIDLNEIKRNLITEKVIKRRFCALNVVREEVEYGNVRAVLYKPNTPGPFKGVIDIYGGGGGLMDVKAPLFASHGFAALVLPFFRYKDLPAEFHNITYDYFLEAIEYFTSLPYVLPGIGLVGLSWGAHIVMMLATISSKISCVVSINGGCLVMPVPINSFHPFTNDDYLKYYITVSKGIDKRGGITHYVSIRDPENIPENCLIKLEKTSAKLLIIQGEGDTTYPFRLSGIRFKERMEQHGKSEQVTYLSYPNAGHFIEPPYLPQTLVHYNPSIKVTQSSGGEEIENAMACVHSWKEILNFLCTNTGSIVLKTSKL